MTASSETLHHIPCIHRYPIQLQRNQIKFKALIDSSSKIDVMTLIYATKLGFTTQKIGVGAQRIDSSLLKTYDMVSASFSLQNSLRRVQFFEKTFLLANTRMEMVSGMLFLALSNADFQFAAEEFTWTSYTAVETLSITYQVELIDKKKFAKTALDENSGDICAACCRSRDTNHNVYSSVKEF